MTDYKLRVYQRLDEITGIDGYALDFCDDYRGSTDDFDSAFDDFIDAHIDIYYHDIIEYLSDYTDEVNAIIDEFGWEGVGRDIYQAAQMAQGEEIRSELCGNISQIIYKLTQYYLEDDDGDDEISVAWSKLDTATQDDLADDFIDAIDRLDESDSIEDIYDAFEDYQNAIEEAAMGLDE